MLPVCVFRAQVREQFAVSTASVKNSFGLALSCFDAAASAGITVSVTRVLPGLNNSSLSLQHFHPPLMQKHADNCIGRELVFRSSLKIS